MTSRKPDMTLALTAAQSCLGFAVRRTARALGQAYDEAFAAIGLKGTQFSLLNATYLMGEAQLSQLAEVLGMDRTTLTRNLGPLQKAGLLSVGQGDDKRVRQIRITGKGRAVLARALPLWRQVQERLMESVEASRLDALRSDLKALSETAGKR